MKHARGLVAAVVAGCLMLACAPGDCRAQDSRASQATDDSGVASQSSSVAWLSGYRFHLAAASLRADDARYRWEAHFGGDLDLVDYGRGRFNLLADYGVIVGSEFRTIDPNQGRYRLVLSTSVRLRRAEVFGFFDHVSRHLSDRANQAAVSWNAAGVRALTTVTGEATRADFELRAGKVVQAAFVDYRWQVGAAVDAARRVSDRASLIGRAEVAWTLVDAAIANRGTQTSGRVEGGIRLSGRAAGLELFAAWERVLDPYPLEHSIRSWPLLGFRFVSR